MFFVSVVRREIEEKGNFTAPVLLFIIFGTIGVITIALKIICYGCEIGDTPPEPTDAVYLRDASDTGNSDI